MSTRKRAAEIRDARKAAEAQRLALAMLDATRAMYAQALDSDARVPDMRKRPFDLPHKPRSRFSWRDWARTRDVLPAGDHTYAAYDVRYDVPNAGAWADITYTRIVPVARSERVYGHSRKHSQARAQAAPSGRKTASALGLASAIIDYRDT
jgi:hypothetical protein